MGLTSLNHHLDMVWMREAYRRTRKDGARGVDQQTAADYEQRLEDNLKSLLEKAKSGRYLAPPVRRVHIEKGNGSKETRPIGIPTLEDKVLQRAIVMLLEPIYEADFLDGSYGFRPGRSAHGALAAIWEQTTMTAGGWVLEVDIRKFFDSVSHSHLRSFVERRVRDGVVLKLIGKWLNAGVCEQGRISFPERGTPQGGVISPLLSNIFLHYVIDVWFETEMKPKVQGKANLIRYADDLVLIFSQEKAAQFTMAGLKQRLEEFGLRLHPEKTRLVYFQRPDKWPTATDQEHKVTSFDFLGFTHYWRWSRRGKWIVYRKTAKDRLTRSIRRASDWCRANRCIPIPEQSRIIGRKMQGHYAYFGITGNMECLGQFHRAVGRIWQKWLNRRSQRRSMTWERFTRLLSRYPLPRPRVVHSIYAT